MARDPGNAARPAATLLWRELGAVADSVARLSRPAMAVEPASDPQVVIMIPGFLTHPVKMRHFARQLERAGHTVKRWGLGFNFGATAENFDFVARRVCEVSERYGRPVVLVGWSLGGIFAREVAKRHPAAVQKVITMGTPFSGSPYANNAWRLYQMVAGHSVEEPPIETNSAEKPPVETVALWSPRDGVISPRSAAGWPGERDRAIALRCTHIGFSNGEEAIRTVLSELSAS
ncbi:esterase/lipase family protein [Paraurantiacibacter namhicola]|nr:alpha/beta fold hydrolase [Paraurantiacibacter namhicola]